MVNIYEIKVWARWATVDTLLRPENKKIILRELLGPGCQPLLVQLSRLLTTLTVTCDPDVRKPSGGTLFFLVIKEALACLLP